MERTKKISSARGYMVFFYVAEIRNRAIIKARSVHALSPDRVNRSTATTLLIVPLHSLKCAAVIRVHATNALTESDSNSEAVSLAGQMLTEPGTGDI